MHRRSNLQCGELFSDFSVNGFGYSCNPCYLPQNMRPYSNRICNTYDYTKNGPRTMFINPAKNCSQPTNTIGMDTATEGTTVLPTETVVQTEVIEPTQTTSQTVQTPASEQFRTRRRPVVRRVRKEKFTNGKVVENLAPVTVATRVTPAMFIPSTPFITQGQPVACLPGNNCGAVSAVGTVMEPVLLERNNFALPLYVPVVPNVPAVPTVATVTPVFTPTLTVEGPENIVYLDRY